MPDNYITKIQGQEELHSGIYYEVDLSLPPIGEGGMGRVYKGFQVEQATGNKRPVAVKFLSLQRIDYHNVAHDVLLTPLMQTIAKYFKQQNFSAAGNLENSMEG